MLSGKKKKSGGKKFYGIISLKNTYEFPGKNREAYKASCQQKSSLGVELEEIFTFLHYT